MDHAERGRGSWRCLGRSLVEGSDCGGRFPMASLPDPRLQSSLTSGSTIHIESCKVRFPSPPQFLSGRKTHVSVDGEFQAELRGSPPRFLRVNNSQGCRQSRRRQGPLGTGHWATAASCAALDAPLGRGLGVGGLAACTAGLRIPVKFGGTLLCLTGGMVILSWSERMRAY